jgi:hypothetical protein
MHSKATGDEDDDDAARVPKTAAAVFPNSGGLRREGAPWRQAGQAVRGPGGGGGGRARSGPGHRHGHAIGFAGAPRPWSFGEP